MGILELGWWPTSEVESKSLCLFNGYFLIVVFSFVLFEATLIFLLEWFLISSIFLPVLCLFLGFHFFHHVIQFCLLVTILDKDVFIFLEVDHYLFGEVKFIRCIFDFFDNSFVFFLMSLLLELLLVAVNKVIVAFYGLFFRFYRESKSYLVAVFIAWFFRSVVFQEHVSYIFCSEFM